MVDVDNDSICRTSSTGLASTFVAVENAEAKSEWNTPVSSLAATIRRQHRANGIVRVPSPRKRIIEPRHARKLESLVSLKMTLEDRDAQDSRHELFGCRVEKLAAMCGERAELNFSVVRDGYPTTEKNVGEDARLRLTDAGSGLGVDGPSLRKADSLGQRNDSVGIKGCREVEAE